MFKKIILVKILVLCFFVSIAQTNKINEAINHGNIKNTSIGNNNTIEKILKDTIIGNIATDNNGIITIESNGNKTKTEIGKWINLNTLIVGNNNKINITKIFYSVGKSVEYNELSDNIKKIEKKIALKNNEYLSANSSQWKESVQNDLNSLYKELDDTLKFLEKFIKDVITLAESFQKIEINSFRLQQAKSLFDQGKFKEADATLKTQDMQNDGNKLLERELKLQNEKIRNDR